MAQLRWRQRSPGESRAAVGAQARVDSREAQNQFLPRRGVRAIAGAGVVSGVDRGGAGIGDSEELFGLGELGVDVAGGVQAEVTDLGEPRGQHVVEKPANELERSHGDGLATLGGETYPAVVDGLDALVGDANAVGVATKIAKDLLGSGEGALGVDDPGDSVEAVEKLIECRVVSEPRSSSGVAELAVTAQPSQAVEELATEELAEDTDVKEKPLAAGDPGLAVVGEAAPGDDAMEMGVEGELSCPGVQDSGDAEAGTEPLGVVAEVEERARSRSEEQAKEQLPIGTGERTQLRREGKHDVEVVGREDVLESSFDPTGLHERLAFGAVAVPARVVGRLLETALGAEVEMSAECLGSAAFDGAHDFELVTGQSVALAIRLPMRAEDVSDLEHGMPRPSYGRGIPMAEHVTLPVLNSSLAETVERALGPGDVLGTHLGVASSRADGTMTEEHLDGPDVSTVFE